MVNTAILGFLPPEVATEFRSNVGLVLPISGEIALAALGVLVLLSSAYFVVLSRTFAQPLSEAGSFPASVTKRLGRASVIALVGGVLVTIMVMIGSVFFLIPGLFLAASFLFFIFVVAVEDEGVISSLKRSWGLARGSRLQLGVLVFASALFGGVIGAIAPLLTLAGLSVAADLVIVVFSAVFFLPYYAIIAAAYLQLRDGQSRSDKPTTGPVDASQTQKL
ncbi:hypothetical protein GCM10008994_13240 [Halorubrum ejinorense]